MFPRRILLSALCGLLMLSSARGDLITIDFDSFSGMSNWRPQLVPSASQLSDQLLSLGVSFRSDADYVAVVDHGVSISSPSVISGVSASGYYEVRDIPIWISFSDPSNPTVEAVTDFVSIRGDPAAGPGAYATMEAFDVSGSSLGTVTALDVSGGLTLSLTLPGIHSILLTQNGDAYGYGGTIGFDNLQFNSVVPVPLPGAALLGFLGLVAAGVKLRRLA